MRYLILVACLGLVACGEPDDTEAPGDTYEADSDTDADADSDSDTDTDPKDVGSPAMAFAMEDINPSSPSYTTVVRSEDLSGTPYGLLFMDSRCTGCIDLADDVWALMAKHPDWYAALPIFGVQSFSAHESVPGTAEPMVENNDLPYLVDVEHNTVWGGYEALNHDLVIISADGVVEAWLPLYVWPEDMADLTAFLEERFGE